LDDGGRRVNSVPVSAIAIASGAPPSSPETALRGRRGLDRLRG
jgi:hypothetical protein